MKNVLIVSLGYAAIIFTIFASIVVYHNGFRNIVEFIIVTINGEL